MRNLHCLLLLPPYLPRPRSCSLQTGMVALTSKPTSSSGAFGAGLTFAVSVALFALGGSWLDSKLGTNPWFVLGGSLLGILGGGIHLVHELAPDVLGFGNRSRPKVVKKLEEASTSPRPANPDRTDDLQ